MVGMGPADSSGKGIMPGNKHDIKRNPLTIIASFGIDTLLLISCLLPPTLIK